jgi:hypothetical protein
MIITKTVQATVSGNTGTANYTFTNSSLLSAGYSSTSFGTTTGGLVTVDLNYNDQVEENGTLNLSVTDTICTVVRTFNFVYNKPVAFTLSTAFVPSGTGGGDCEYTTGAINLTRLVSGSIPTLYTVVVKINGVIRNPLEYTITWNGLNYVLNAISLGAASLLAGTHNLTIEVTQVSNGSVFTSQTFVLPVCA